MNNRPSVSQNEDEYWRFARDLVRVLISDVNSELKSMGRGRDERRSICETLIFAIANRLDQSWIRSDGLLKYPSICFSDGSVDDSPGGQQFLIRAESVELHAMVTDEVEWFFGDAEEQLPVGLVGTLGSDVPELEPADDPLSAKAGDEPEPPMAFPCAPCGGTGQCFCIRKGPGNSTGCARCGGSGKCRHCDGVGKT